MTKFLHNNDCNAKAIAIPWLFFKAFKHKNKQAVFVNKYSPFFEKCDFGILLSTLTDDLDVVTKEKLLPQEIRI